MKSTHLYSFLLLFSIFKVSSQNFPIYKVKSAITIDGNLSDWKNPFLGPFLIHNTSGKATQETFVSLSWNDENLYLAYKCQDSNIIGSKQNKDSRIFETDDLAEIFLDPDGDGKNYVEVGVNAFSTYYDVLLKCISPECGGWNMAMEFDIKGIETVSTINNEGYIVEIKIPFSSLEKTKNGNFTKPKAGTKWKGNAFRIDYGNTTEYLALQPYKSNNFGFHQPKEFAVFEFVE